MDLENGSILPEGIQLGETAGTAYEGHKGA